MLNHTDNEIRAIKDFNYSGTDFSYTEKVNESRFKNFDELDEYLDKKFIPKRIKTKKIKDKETGEIEYFSSVPLSKILELRISTKELEHIINYLEEKDVRVGGMDSTLDSEFSNYDYITTYKSTPLPETLTGEEEKNLFEEYNKSKDKSIKEKIILANLKLVSFINYKIAMTYNIDINELNSYGYEKLIMLVDRFDPSKGYRFSTLAYTSIKRMIYANLPKILGYQHLETYKTFMEASKKMREMYDENGISEEVALSEIIDLIKNTEDYGKVKFRNLEKEILIANTKNIDSIREEDYVDDYSLERKETDIAAYQTLMNLLSRFPEKHRDIIIERYGFEDGIFKTLKEVGKKFQMSGEWVRKIEEGVIEEIRDILLSNTNITKHIYPIQLAYDEYNYNEEEKFKKI